MTTSRHSSAFTNARATARLLLLGVVVALALTALVPLGASSTVDAAGHGHTVTVNKRACPAGFNAYGATYIQLTKACKQRMDGVFFVLGSHEGSQNVWDQQVTGANLAGGAVWTGVAAGQITLAEQLPTGYGRPVVYCAGGTQSDPGAMVQMTLASTFHLVYAMQAGQNLTCDWFNVPSSRFGTNRS